EYAASGGIHLDTQLREQSEEMRRALEAEAAATLFNRSGLREQASDRPRTAVLQARRNVDGRDNYTQAAFSFKFGVNGDDAVALTHNNWDVLFGNSPDRDTFQVTMVTDDCSRILDLGELKWSDIFVLPALPAHP